MVDSTTQFPTSLRSYVCRHNPHPALRDSISVRGQHYDMGKVAFTAHVPNCQCLAIRYHCYPIIMPITNPCS